MEKQRPVIMEPTSLHGGHSGQYCSHAQDLLEEILNRYIELGFKKVGITEHIPPINDQFLYPDEKAAGLNAIDLYKRFEEYFIQVNVLKKKYVSKIKVFSGMETETYSGYPDYIKKLIKTFQPDYIVGSVHHINDICFDYSKEEYNRICTMCGSYESMYEIYFDLQYEMIQKIKPFVVGHFDLIRIYDPDYKKRVLHPSIDKRIKRNLKLIKSLNLVMDYNLRALTKGAKEPYITDSILQIAKEMNISVVPGDDSHGVNEAGVNVDKALKTLNSLGFKNNLPDPILFTKEK
jgi:histidinol-phosphatase (PHP family)